MSTSDRVCSICSAEADWVRVRMPNAKQMTYLCHRHYQFLLEHNPLLASYYDSIAAVSPMEMETDGASEKSHNHS